MKRKNLYAPPEAEVFSLEAEAHFCESVNKNFSTPHNSDDPFPEMTDVDINSNDWQ